MCRAPIAAVLLRALLLATVAGSVPLAVTASPEASEPAAEPASGDTALRASTANTDNYFAGITALESEHGAYSAALPEQLLSLGLTLQQEGRHTDALDVFRRGVHLDRINNGLYSAGQVALVQQEIISHIALGDFAKADERQHYMYRVQMRTMNNGADRSKVFMEQAQWQYNAYRLDLGPAPYLRLMNMWDLYRLALNDTINTHGKTSAYLLEPLEGMLLAQYLISGYERTSSPKSQTDLGVSLQTQDNRFNRYQRESYKRGRAVIQAIYDLHLVNHGENSAETTETMVMMGDWIFWHGDKEAALRAYQQANAELVARGADQQTIEATFAEPVALPNFDGVRPLPQPVQPGDGAVQLAFSVTATGKVRELERVDENTLDDATANKLMRKLRRTRFRPQLALGEPVDTQRVLRAYDIQ
ncbi:hypothetical protein EY643_02155 [Halioglobus maricola]|uniref:TonB family protein n=1 Tax=Halioglobus maricola TaxID=2601894 RepID=A0A5P9NFH9_9GAMM|nr:hypothetical protein [Halioglobus maricola]QFU74547.1 hypothetical protein EY643_02155 [Halioglobus maricola]